MWNFRAYKVNYLANYLVSISILSRNDYYKIKNLLEQESV